MKLCIDGLKDRRAIERLLSVRVIFQDESLRLDARFLEIMAILLGLAKSQQSVQTSFGKVVCESKAAELDFPSSVPKTSLYM
jgi:hypothetical protein